MKKTNVQHSTLNAQRSSAGQRSVPATDNVAATSDLKVESLKLNVERSFSDLVELSGLEARSWSNGFSRVCTRYRKRRARLKALLQPRFCPTPSQSEAAEKMTNVQHSTFNVQRSTPNCESHHVLRSVRAATAFEVESLKLNVERSIADASEGTEVTQR
jgi:hypothetical protein